MLSSRPFSRKILFASFLSAQLAACSEAEPTSFVTAIVVSPAAPSLAAGASQQLTATSKFPDGRTRDVTSTVTWSSLDPAVVTVSPSGVVTAGSLAGTGTITATLDETVGVARVSVTGAALGLTAIVISPASPTLAPGASQQLTATGKFPDGRTQDVTSSVTWASLDPDVATIAATGAVTASSFTGGTATLTATLGETVGVVRVSVSGASLAWIELRPGSLRLPATVRSPLLVIGRFSDGSERDLSSLASATTDTPAAASASCAASGCFVETLAAGSAVVTATVGSRTASSTLEVTGATLSSLQLAPGNLPAVEVGATVGFSAYGRFSDGMVVDVTDLVTWASSDGGVATVSGAGSVTGVAAGLAAIQASRGGVSSPAQSVTVASSLLDYRETRLPFSYTRVATIEPLVIGDDLSEAIPEPDPVFDFALMGTGFTASQIYVGTNGVISFGYAETFTTGPALIPGVDVPNGFVAVNWSDLVTSVSYEFRGTAPARELVIQWSGRSYVTNAPVEFQAILHETSNEVDLVYIQAGTDYGTLALAGIEGPDGLTGTQHSSGVAAIASSTAIRFSP